MASILLYYCITNLSLPKRVIGSENSQWSLKLHKLSLSTDLSCSEEINR